MLVHPAYRDSQDRLIRAYLDDVQVLEYEADRNLDGYVGLWTKADSVTLFKGMIFEAVKSSRQ